MRQQALWQRLKVRMARVMMRHADQPEKLKSQLEAALVKAAGLQLQGRQFRLRAERAEAAKAVAEVELSRLRKEVQLLRDQARTTRGNACWCQRAAPPALSKEWEQMPDTLTSARLLKQIPVSWRAAVGPGEDGFKPQWDGDYLAAMLKQESTDPDTIFGSVPHCDLLDIFPEELYDEVEPNAKRQRLEPTCQLDQLFVPTREVRAYKQRMGQTRSWLDLAPQKQSSLAHELRHPRCVPAG
ncbi:unnamed protein product [Effrenium voratum]|nr:unnamed protein product [Effrenium voratum]